MSISMLKEISNWPQSRYYAALTAEIPPYTEEHMKLLTDRDAEENYLPPIEAKNLLHVFLFYLEKMCENQGQLSVAGPLFVRSVKSYIKYRVITPEYGDLYSLALAFSALPESDGYKLITSVIFKIVKKADADVSEEVETPNQEEKGQGEATETVKTEKDFENGAAIIS